MIEVTFKFHAGLNFFLPPEEQNQPVQVTLSNHPAVKDTIESLGIPHPEVDVIVIDGACVDFDFQLQDKQHVEVFPYNREPDVEPLIHLQPPLPENPRFILDTHLGKLAAYLRMIGYDSLYENDYSDEEMAEISVQEDRYLLSRDRGLLKRGIVSRGYYLRSTDPQEQLSEVIQRFDLSNRIQPFKRCMTCNGELNPVKKEEIQDRLEDDTRKYYDDFYICNQCGKIYWQGSHYQHMKSLIERVVNSDKS
jgi:uncharacterized protein with PIN domain